MRSDESNTFHDTLTSYVLITNGVCVISAALTKGNVLQTKILIFLLFLSFLILLLLLNVLDFFLVCFYRTAIAPKHNISWNNNC